MTQLGFPGAMLFSNVNGVALADERYWPLYQRANELDAVLYIHPESPVGVEAMTDYWLMPLVGFPFDTTLAAAKLVMGGVAVLRYLDPSFQLANPHAVAGTGVFGQSSTFLNSFSYATMRAKAVTDITTADDTTSLGAGGSFAVADPTAGLLFPSLL